MNEATQEAAQEAPAYFQLPTPSVPDMEFYRPYLAQIQANPHCKTCYGRGYTGIVRVPSRDRNAGAPVLQLCHCAELVDTTLSRLQDTVSSLVESMQISNAAHGKFQTLMAGEFNAMREEVKALHSRMTNQEGWTDTCYRRLRRSQLGYYIRTGWILFRRRVLRQTELDDYPL